MEHLYENIPEEIELETLDGERDFYGYKVRTHGPRGFKEYLRKCRRCGKYYMAATKMGMICTSCKKPSGMRKKCTSVQEVLALYGLDINKPTTKIKNKVDRFMKIPCEHCNGKLAVYVDKWNGDEYIQCVDCKHPPTEDYLRKNKCLQ